MIIRRKKGLPMLKEYKKKRTHHLDVFSLRHPLGVCYFCGIRQLPILPCSVSKLNACVELYRFCRRLLLRQNYRCRQGEQAFVLFAKK